MVAQWALAMAHRPPHTIFAKERPNGGSGEGWVMMAPPVHPLPAAIALHAVVTALWEATMAKHLHT